MNGTSSTTLLSSNRFTSGVDTINPATTDATRITHSVDPSALLPDPGLLGDGDSDLMASLAMMMIEQKHEDRVTNDAQAQAASHAQQEAQARKISKMHELADDTFASGLIEGIGDGVSAAATAGSAVLRFRGEIDVAESSLIKGDDRNCIAARDTLESSGKGLLRDSSLLDAGGTAGKAVTRFLSAGSKSDEELDRADMAVADADIDRAKGAADTASTQSRRDQDDIKDIIGAYRSYASAKTQLGQSAIIRG